VERRSADELRERARDLSPAALEIKALHAKGPALRRGRGRPATKLAAGDDPGAPRRVKIVLERLRELLEVETRGLEPGVPIPRDVVRERMALEFGQELGGLVLVGAPVGTALPVATVLSLVRAVDAMIGRHNAYVLTAQKKRAPAPKASANDLVRLAAISMGWAEPSVTRGHVVRVSKVRGETPPAGRKLPTA
jgi:hypothetical protein